MFRYQRQSRLVVAAALIGFAVLASATPASAGSGFGAWIGDPAGWSNLGSFGNLNVERGSSLTLAFGARGVPTAGTVEATMEAPDFPGVSIKPEQSGCSTTGRSVRCLATVENGVMFGDASIWTTASTPLGYAGIITISTPGGTSATVPLWVISSKLGTDMEIRTTNANGKVGDTVNVKVTVTNHGPNPQPWWGIGGLRLPGAKLVGQHGCSPGLLSGVTWQCAHTAFMAVGASVTVSFDIQIVGAGGVDASGGFNTVTYLSDPTSSNVQGSFDFRAGPSGGTNSQHNGSAAGGGTGVSAGETGAATPSASASPDGASSATPQSGAIATDVPVQPVAERPVAATRPLGVVWAVAGILVALGAAATGYLLSRRRRRPAAIAGAVQDEVG